MQRDIGGGVGAGMCGCERSCGVHMRVHASLSPHDCSSFPAVENTISHTHLRIDFLKRILTYYFFFVVLLEKLALSSILDNCVERVKF